MYPPFFWFHFRNLLYMYKHGAASSVLSYIVQTLKTRARCMQNMQYKGNKTNLVFMLFDALNAFFSIQTEKDRLHMSRLTRKGTLWHFWRFLD